MGRMSGMEAVIRKVQDIEESDRHALEHVLGQQLGQNQQIIIQVVSLGSDTAQTSEKGASASDELPGWCTFTKA
jgi:hypothetical protein